MAKSSWILGEYLNDMISTLTVIGTRPEMIKLAPVLTVLRQNSRFKNKLCVTRQHTDLLDPFLVNLGIPVDYHFENHGSQTLHRSAARILEQFDPIFLESKPDLMIVQGDTTTAFIASLAAYYACVPVAHVEAGLRTGNLYSPWPEEAHRSLIARLATYSFAPTLQAKNALISEGISPDKIWVVGNTSIDAIRMARKSVIKKPKLEKMIVVTVHRRENQGKPLTEICQALRELIEKFSTLKIKFLMHPNPCIQNSAIQYLANLKNIDLIKPLDHPSFIDLLEQSEFIITDSGGVQEEASFLGKPVLIVRNTTERAEGIFAGTARLVGTNSESIITVCKELLQNPNVLTAMSRIHYPYGDGYSAERIVSILLDKLSHG